MKVFSVPNKAGVSGVTLVLLIVLLFFMFFVSLQPVFSAMSLLYGKKIHQEVHVLLSRL